MSIDRSKLKQVYNTLKGGGYEQDYDSFKRGFLGNGNYKNRKQVYDLLSQNGAQIGGSYEEFMKHMQVQPGQQKGNVGQTKQQNTATPMTAEDKRKYIESAGNIIIGSQDELARANRKIDYANKHRGLDVTPIKVGFGGGASVKLGENRKVVKDNNFGNTRYINEEGNQYDNRAQADLSQSIIDDYKKKELNPIEGSLKDAYLERERLENALAHRQQELQTRHDAKPWYTKMIELAGKASHSDLDPNATATDPEHMGFENDEQYMQLMSALRKNKQAIAMLEDKKQGKMNNFWHALGEAATNSYTFNDGLPEMRDATALINAQKHLDSINRKRKTGEQLTQEELAAEAVLKNSAASDNIQSKYGQDYGAWSRAGSMMAQSLDFMKDFLLAPDAAGLAKGIAKGVSKVGGKYLTKEAGEGVAKASMKAIARGTLKATGVLVGAHTAGAVISNTTGLGRTAANMGGKLAGNATTDEKGNYKIENQDDSFMHALASAEREQIRENGSEMFGEFIPGGKYLGGLAKKGLEKIGLSKVSNYLTSIGSKQWYKQYTTLLEKGGYNGIPGEALEEYEGSLFDALTGHAEDAYRDLTDKRNNVDIWLGCATMGALMGAVPMTMHAAGYMKYKHGLNKADKNATRIINPDKWEALKDEIDGTDNANMTDFVVKNVLDNKELNAGEKNAALNYVRNLTKYRGFNIAQANNAEPEEAHTPQEATVEATNNSYSDGYNAEDERLAPIKDEYEMQLRKMENTYGEGSAIIDEIDNDPIAYINNVIEKGDEAHAQEIVEYANAKAAYDGMIQRVRDDLDSKITESNTEIEQRANRDTGQIVPATMKTDDRKVYIVSGNIVMHDDGKGVNNTASSDRIAIRDAETGKIEFSTPDQVLSVDAPLDVEQEKQAAVENIQQTFAQERANLIDGIVDFAQGTTHQLLDEQGQMHNYAILQDNGDGSVTVTIDNNTSQLLLMPKEQLQEMADMTRKANIQQVQDQDLTEEANNESEVNSPQQEQEVVENASSMPMTEEEEPDFAKVEPTRAHQYLYNEAGLSRDEANGFVKANLSQAQKTLEKAKKNPPVIGTSIQKYRKAQEEYQTKVDEAQAAVDYWNAVKGEQDKIDAAEAHQRAEIQAEETRKAKEVEEQRQQEELHKQAEQKERGANNVAPSIKEKWENAPKIDGAENEIVLPNGDHVSGHYVLTESGAASASHNATSEFVKTEGFPVDENGQSVNDRDYERDKDAQNVTRNIARNYDSRALQTPVVVSKDGVVLSGNGRTMAGELAAKDNTDTAYTEHLQKYPQQYGFTKEQVNGMKHPRVVFVPDADMPYNADTFAKFNQQEMKGQSKTEQAVKLGKVVDDKTFSRIIRSINGYDTLGDFYADNRATREAIKDLQTAGVLTEVQTAEMFDGEGISAQGREVLENMLIGKAFESNPDAVREITAFKSMRQSVITALAEIVNNKALGEEYSLEKELAEAIRLVYRARKDNHKAGDRVSSYARQQNLFTFDEGDTVADYTNATMLMLADVLNDNRSTQLKKILAVYNQKASDSAAGQLDMFSGGVQSKEEIWNDVKQLIDYGTEEQLQQSIREATEQRKASVQQNEPVSGSDEGSGEINEHGYSLSEEKAENGERFYQDLNGNINLADIPSEVFDIINKPKAPFRLTPSMLKHVFDRHGKEMGLSQADDAIDFVLDVMDNFDHVRQGDRGAIIFSIEKGRSRTGRRAVTVLLDSQSGEYYGIKTSGYERIEGLTKRPLLWEKGAIETSTTGVAPANVTTEKAQQGNEPTGSASNQSYGLVGKDSKLSDTKQEKSPEFEDLFAKAERIAKEDQEKRTRKAEEAKVDTNPTEKQKEAGNYKKGHIKVDGLDITIEQPKGSIRRGKDADGKQWESEMHYTYGYIRGTEGVDGDHVDIFLSDNPTEGNVYVVDQVNKDGTFDEHKVMYGFPDAESAKQAYLSNYEEGWQGLGNITEVNKEDFKKWINSSKRKTKPFAEYSFVRNQSNNDIKNKLNEDLSKQKKDVSPQHKSLEAEKERAAAEISKKENSEKTNTNEVQKSEAELREQKKQELRNKLKTKLRGQLNIGVDPELFMIGVELASMEIEDGARKFADFAKRMIAEIGDEIRPYLKAIYNGVRDLPGMETISEDMTSYDEVKTFNIATIDKEGEETHPTILDTAEQVSNEQTVERSIKKEQENTTETEDVDNETYSITKQHNNKKDIDIWVVRDKGERTSREIYLKRKEEAKKNGNGYWSSFVKGFVFEKPEDAHTFADNTFNLWKKNGQNNTGSLENYAHNPKENIRDNKKAETYNNEELKKVENDTRGFKVGDKVLYKGKEATIFDFDNGNPVLDTGLAPVLYELADYKDIEPLSNKVDTLKEKAEESLPKENSEPKKSVSLKQNKQLGLFDDTDTDNKPNEKENEKVNLRTGTSTPEREERQQLRQDEPLGKSTEHEDERTDGGRVGRRSESHSKSDTTGSTRVSGQPKGSERLNLNNNHAERGVDYAPRGVDGRIDANIKAIELMQQLIESGEKATPEQMVVLRQFSGWGGLGKAFKEKQYRWEPDGAAEKLRSLLGNEAFEQAEMSRNSAYYTPANVIDTMWDIVKALGFKGGNILEGSAGIGNILGLMPREVSENSHIHAVEIDQTTGNILSLLYPDAKTEIQGFEQTKIPNGSVDLAITNVPFVTGLRVNDTTGDSDLSKKFHDIHDFCIAKNIRKLKEGGIGVFISSNGTLDNSKRLRDWIVSNGNADVIGAFRMNNETFGGTSATSDIIIVRKRVNGKKSVNAIDVSHSVGVRAGEFNKPGEKKVTKVSMDYNGYFVEHPENMGGEMKFGYEEDNMYRPGSKSCYPVKGINQRQRLEDWAKTFASMTEEPIANVTENATSPVYEKLGNDIKEGSLFINKDNELCIAHFGEAVPLELNNNKVKGHTKQECFAAYSEIKSALNDVLSYQTENTDDKELKKLQYKLNKAYDSFVDIYGHFTKNTAISFLKNDLEYSSVSALETTKEDNDQGGNRRQIFIKSDVFSKRVVEKEVEPHPTSIKEGVLISQYKNGRIDIPYIAQQLGKEDEEVREDVISSGIGFEDPISREIIVSYEYLSGNVREKLSQANAANENGEYNNNITALEKVVPAEIPAHLIEFSLGSSWIPTRLFTDYFKHKTGLDVKVVNVEGTWLIDTPYYTGTEINRAMGVHSEKCDKTIYGDELIAAAMKNKTINVSKTKKHYDGSIETIVDKEATQACATKIDEIRDDFKDWARSKIQDDDTLTKEIEKIYNEKFNNYVFKTIPEEFYPKHFVGASSAITLRPHQAQAAIRATTENLMLAHEVGAGKTYTLISTAMEMRRLGTSRKPMIVVQNATVGQFASSAKQLYPNAKILTLEDKDRTSEGRMTFYAKIKYNDWDMVIIPQSTLERIPDSEERQMAFIKDKIGEKLDVLNKMRDSDADRNSIREAEREVSKLEAELAILSDTSSERRKERDAKKEAITRQNAAVKAQEMLNRVTDDVENFDDMGIDALLVDEAHEYKHLGFATAMQRGVKGVDPSYSKKSQGVYLKCQSVMEKSGGKNVVFATGTPISNTAAEIWTFMRYLMPADTMKAYDIYYFDDFVRNFGNISQMAEFKTNGKFDEVNRFKGYTNLPELVRIWSSVSDTFLTEEAEGLKEKLPELSGGRAEDIYLPQTKALRSVMKYVKVQLDEYDKMSGKEKKENSHIPLLMYGIAKAAAVDPRLVMNDAEDEPNSKTNEAVRRTLQALEQTKDYKGTVAIFADVYQNKASGFNLYKDIKDKLVAAGISENQIAIVNGMSQKKKQELFDKVNSGDVRVVLGSTFTLGTGVNIQERLNTLIHLDAPNRPMDYTQRNGRILRQGNLHKEMGMPVHILRFGVEDSLDVTAYQRLKTKGAIADSIMRGKRLMQDAMNNRTMEEEEDVFGDTVAQLSGSQYALLKQQAERELRKFIAKQRQWEADQIYIHRQKPRLEGQIENAKDMIIEDQKHLAVLEKHNGNTAIIVGKNTYGNIEEASELLKAQNKAIKDETEWMRKNPGTSKQERSLSMNIGGFNFDVKTVLKKETESKGVNLFTSVHRTMTYSCKELGIEDAPVKQGLLRNAIEDILENVLSGNDYRERVERMENFIERSEKELKQLSEREGKPFEFTKELEAAKAHVEEYTEKMKEELAEKEAKYAELDKDVEAAEDLSEAVEDDEDVLYREENSGNSVDKEKAQTYISASALNADATYKDELSSAANIIKDFHNPNVNADILRESEENVSGVTTPNYSHYTKEQQQAYALRQIRRAHEMARKTIEELHLNDKVDIIEDAENAGLEGKRSKAKGWYDKTTDRITIVIGNHRSPQDVVTTILHEAVAHYGLRKLFGSHFDDFLYNVYAHGSEEVRRALANLALKKYGGKIDVATEEYLAKLVENTDFEHAMKSGWWQQIKDWFMSMLHKVGFKDYNGSDLTNSELRYILWRSYENLKEPGRYRSILSEAADIDKQNTLGVGNYDENKDIIGEQAAEDSLLLRDGDPEAHERKQVRDKYEKRIRSGLYQTQEAMIDSMRSLHDAMLMIADDKKHVEDIEGFENAYLGENRLSSVNEAEVKAFASLLFKPLLNEVSKLAKTKEERQQLTDYMMAKHGLERNVIMAERNAQKDFDIYSHKHEDSNKTLDDFISQARERDYAGLTALTGEDDIEVAEDAARQMVREYEEAHDTKALWNKIKAVNNSILSKSFECGLMNKETYEDIKGMYKYYIPLRGFDEETSREAYGYLTHRDSAFNAPIKTAKGRSSKADDPLANMESMAESTIAQGNRNTLVKQRFLNFVLNHPSDLVSVSDLWLQHNEVTDEWEPVLPNNIEEGDTAEEVEQKLKDFEDHMEELQKQSPEEYLHGADTVNIPYRVLDSRDLHQHQVIVKRNGRDIVLTVNGDPRLAQALNGQTNPDAAIRGSIGAMVNLVGDVNRTLSSLYTTFQPDFIVSNFLRDTLYSNTMVWVKESPKYASYYNANFAKLPLARMKTLLAKYRNGTLDIDNETDFAFQQFMRNGGETGFLRMADIESHKKDINKILNSMSSNLPLGAAREALITWIGEVGRAIEMRARFAAYVTSRKAGRSVDRSIWDAKEISVNFNKKGAGDTMLGQKEQTKVGNIASFTSGAGRTLYVFWNAALQGTFNNFGKQVMRNPAKSTALMLGAFSMGVLISALGAAGSGDDDYYDQPETTRRQNLLIKGIGNTWIKIPLSIEYRSFYGMGELAGSVIFNNEHLEIEDLASQMSQMLPIDFMEGTNSLYPSAVKPVVEVAKNESWYGSPIWKESEYNKSMPQWTKAFVSTNRDLVNLAAILNDVSGGNKYRKGTVDLNPAAIEYLLRQYTGGFFTVVNQLRNMGDVAVGDKDFDWRYVPLANRVIMTGGDERNASRGLNNKFFDYMDRYQATLTELNGFKNDPDYDLSQKASLIDSIVSDKNFLLLRQADLNYKRLKRAKQDATSAGNQEAVKEIDKLINDLKHNVVKEMER